VFSGAVQFDAAGTPLSSDTFTAMSGTQCVVSETEDGGASNVTYLCTDIPRGNSCDGLQTTGASQFTVGNFDGAVEVAVQNEMNSTSGSLPQPVVVEPALTG
jgi:hypothetical protein